MLEGYVDPAEPLRREGPFGDHTGYYCLEDDYPVFHVTAVTRRRQAIYPATVVGRAAAWRTTGWATPPSGSSCRCSG